MADTMLYSLLLMVFACWTYTIAVVLRRAQAIILERKKVALWASQISKK